MRIDTTKRISNRDLSTPIREFISPVTYNFTLDHKVEDVLQTLRSRKVDHQEEEFFITNKENILQGVLSISDLVYCSPKATLQDLIDTDLVKLREEDLLEKGLKLLTSHKTLALPVVNEEDRLVGILEVMPGESDFFPVTKKIHYKHMKEDIFQFIGFSIEQKKWSSPWTEYKLRMPWLLCNLVGGLICAVIAHIFEATLVETVLLAFFIPLVLTLSESISIQSMTLSLRFLHLRKVHWKQVWRRIFVEGKSSSLLGVTSAFIIGIFYFAWSVSLKPILSIGMSVIIGMMTSAFFGAIFPIILHALKLDPKVAAGPVVLMMADILTIAIYLGLATLVLM